MAARVLRLGTERIRGEGLRIGTVRQPPRGVPKEKFASGNWYDVWLPILAPSVATVNLGRKAETDREWAMFERRYVKEMSRPECSRTLDLLAALSHETDFSVGCYCEDESHCHRSILRRLLKERGAKLA